MLLSSAPQSATLKHFLLATRYLFGRPYPKLPSGLHHSLPVCYHQPHTHTMSTYKVKKLSADILAKYRDSFYSDQKNLLAQNFVSRSDPLDATLTRAKLESANHVYTHKVDEAKPVTNQKSSGRCWLFACLNGMRIPFMKEKNLDDFEFSQGHLFFWDKIERSNYFLNTVVNVAQREPRERPDGRLLSFLLTDPVSDGGQWDMVVNLVNKHGLMPKKCFPESFSCESSRRMNDILKTKLREFCQELYSLIDNGACDETLQDTIASQMEVVYRIVGICLGVPPKEFTWECYDKSKEYKTIGPLTPLTFYLEHVKPTFDVDTKICLVSDPRPQNPVGKTYTVDCLGNMVEGRKTIYCNQPIETLIELTAKAIQEGHPVWFGCDVAKHFASKQGLMDVDIHDHSLVYGTSVRNISKADRLIYGDSVMNHAMLFTGVTIDEDTKRPTKWRVENSWGEDRHEKGYLCMTTNWFKEFVFEVVVDKTLVPEEVLKTVDMEPILLPAWDPMGTLAR